MTTSRQRTRGVDLWDVGVLRLVESVAPPVPVEHQRERDRLWAASVAANPTGLFDGPVVVCTDLRCDAGAVVLSWAPVTYRYFALRRVPGAAVLPGVFVCVVQPTEEGGLLVGRMSATTATPGRWQLPGGSVEPPARHGVLDVAALRRHAARELDEETGIVVSSDDLVPWVLSRGGHRSVGVHFLAPPLPEAVIRERFGALLDAEAAAGRDPEFAEIAFVRSAADLDRLAVSRADYLAPLLDRAGARDRDAHREPGAAGGAVP